MTVLNNFTRLLRGCLGMTSNTGTSSQPTIDPTNSTYNSFLFQDANAYYYPQGSNSKSTVSYTSFWRHSIDYVGPYTTTNLGTSNGFLDSVELITEDFSILNNEYPVNSEGSGPSSIKSTSSSSDISITISQPSGVYKTTYTISYTNSGTGAVTIYGFQLDGNISAYRYSKSSSSWGSSAAAYAYPCFVVKLTEPKTLQSGDSLTLSYTIDLSNIVSESNNIVVTQS